MLQWARQEGCPWDEYTCENAARGGLLALLQWAATQGCPWCSYDMYVMCADETGHAAVAEWVDENKDIGVPHYAFDQ